MIKWEKGEREGEKGVDIKEMEGKSGEEKRVRVRRKGRGKKGRKMKEM